VGFLGERIEDKIPDHSAFSLARSGGREKGGGRELSSAWGGGSGALSRRVGVLRGSQSLFLKANNHRNGENGS